MVFKRRRLSRFRFRRRIGGRFRRRRFSKFIKRTIRKMHEVKWATRDDTTVVNANSAIFQNVNPDTPVGADKFQRIGNRLRYKNLQLRLSIYMPSLDDAPDWQTRSLRIIVFQKRTEFSNPPSPSLQDVLDVGVWDSSVNGVAVRLMYDKSFSITPSNDANQHGVGMQRIIKKMNFRVRNNVSFRDSGVVTPSDIKDQYFFFIITDYFGQGVTGYEVHVDWFSRISFVDI